MDSVGKRIGLFAVLPASAKSSVRTIRAVGRSRKVSGSAASSSAYDRLSRSRTLNTVAATAVDLATPRESAGPVTAPSPAPGRPRHDRGPPPAGRGVPGRVPRRCRDGAAATVAGVNRLLDRLPRGTVHIGAREVPAFRSL